MKGDAAERSSRMMMDDLKATLADWRAVVTDRRAVSVEWPVLKPDGWGQAGCSERESLTVG